MPATATPPHYRDALHAVALDRMRRKHRPGYRWWVLLALAAAIVALWAFCS